MLRIGSKINPKWPKQNKTIYWFEWLSIACKTSCFSYLHGHRLLKIRKKSIETAWLKRNESWKILSWLLWTLKTVWSLNCINPFFMDYCVFLAWLIRQASIYLVFKFVHNISVVFINQHIEIVYRKKSL